MIAASTRRVAAAITLTVLVALAVYRATMLPGFDFADMAAFQDRGQPRSRRAVRTALLSPFGWIAVHAAGGEPALGMNLASVVCGAIACGLITRLGHLLFGSVIGGLFAGLLFASCTRSGRRRSSPRSTPCTW